MWSQPSPQRLWLGITRLPTGQWAGRRWKGPLLDSVATPTQKLRRGQDNLSSIFRGNFSFKRMTPALQNARSQNSISLPLEFRSCFSPLFGRSRRAPPPPFHMLDLRESTDTQDRALWHVWSHACVFAPLSTPGGQKPRVIHLCIPAGGQRGTGRRGWSRKEVTANTQRSCFSLSLIKTEPTTILSRVAGFWCELSGAGPNTITCQSLLLVLRGL